MTANSTPPIRAMGVLASVAVLALATAPACDRSASEPPEPTTFQIPIEGEQDVDWFYGPLPNHENERDQAEDYQCGVKTIDFRQTTDFLIPGFRDMDLGVSVYAAAAGEVVRVEDGNYDRELQYQFTRVGNSVRIRHDDGFESRYRFLKSGSIRVRPGDKVAAGEIIAEVGSSGNSNWPRLGFEVRNPNGDAFDPWAGACSGSRSFWTAQPAYPNTFITIDHGTTNRPLNLRLVANRPPTVTQFRPGEAVGFWAHIINRPVGELTFRLIGPTGTLDSAGGNFDWPDPENSVFGGLIILGSNAPLGDWAIEYFMNGETFALIEWTVAGDPVVSTAEAVAGTAPQDWTLVEDAMVRSARGGVAEVQLPEGWVLDGEAR